jgi:hypothetical protein
MIESPMKHESLNSPTGFILVNQTIQDYSDYVKRVLLLKNFLKMRLTEAVLVEGFNLEESSSFSYSQSTLTFFDDKSDLEIRIDIRKRNKESFV